MAERFAVAPFLAGVPLFAGVPLPDLAEVGEASRVRTYPRGQVVFSTGDPSDTLLIVVSGRVKVVLRSADGGELMLTVVGPQGTVGELGVIDGGARSADAETLDATEAVFVPREAILDLRERFPVVTASLLAGVAAGFRRLTEAAADLVFLDLPRRVGKALLDHPRDDDGVVELGLSQEELSHRVAGTRQSVNQALRAFERRGWIVLDGRRLVLLDPAALARFAGEEVSGR
jgi:CRP/FNR family transcriptional regulator, cyclic AMP receptor protein